MVRGIMGMDKNYQARCDAHTLREAEEIKASAARHRAAQAHAKDEMKKLEKVVAKPAGRRAVKK